MSDPSKSISSSESLKKLRKNMFLSASLSNRSASSAILLWGKQENDPVFRIWHCHFQPMKTVIRTMFRVVKWMWWNTYTKLIYLKPLNSKNRIFKKDIGYLKNDLCRDRHWCMELVIVAFVAISTIRVKVHLLLSQGSFWETSKIIGFGPISWRWYKMFILLICGFTDECFDDDISIHNNSLGSPLDSSSGDSFSEFLIPW